MLTLKMEEGSHKSGKYVVSRSCSRKGSRATHEVPNKPVPLQTIQFYLSEILADLWSTKLSGKCFLLMALAADELSP